MSAASGEPEGQPRTRNWLIVVLAVVVLCCLFAILCAAGWYLYSYGDQLFGLAGRVAGGWI